MWLNFDKIEWRTDLVSRKGAPYSAFIVYGTKRGFDKEEDSPYEKIVFDNATVTVVEDGVHRPGQSLAGFFKSCKQGDLVILKSVRKQNRWEVATVENRGTRGSVQEYVPLTPEERELLKAKQTKTPDNQKPVFAESDFTDEPVETIWED